MLDWSLADLSKAAHVSVSSIKRAETEDVPVAAEAATKIKDALEAEGVSFLPDDDRGAGVRSRGKTARKTSRNDR